MKYIDADLLRKEIEKRTHICNGIFERDSDIYFQGKAIAYDETISFLDTISEEPDKSLEEAAEEYASDYPAWNDEQVIAKYAFKRGAEWQKHQDQETIELAEEHAMLAGAEWQKEQFEKNRIAACDKQTKEEYDREVDFSTGIIEKEHRQPTFSDAINYGIKWQKEQMMKDAVECVVCAGMEGDKWIMTYIGDYESMLKTCKAGDKVRIIIVKED